MEEIVLIVRKVENAFVSKAELFSKCERGGTSIKELSSVVPEAGRGWQMQYPFALMLSHYFTQLTGALSVFPILALKKMRVIIPLCESFHAYIYSA